MKKYSTDLDYLIRTLETVHPNLYHNVSRDEIHRLINELKSRSINSLADFFYQTKLILAKINDPHTLLFDYVCEGPFDLKIIDGHVYIIRTSNRFSNILYEEIISINNIDISIIIDEINKSLSYLCNE